MCFYYVHLSRHSTQSVERRCPNPPPLTKIITTNHSQTKCICARYEISFLMNTCVLLLRREWLAYLFDIPPSLWDDAHIPYSKNNYQSYNGICTCYQVGKRPNKTTFQLKMAGLGGSVGCAVRLETRRSRVQPPPRSATFFRGD